MLKDALQQLAATGSSGFEGLIQRLLGRLTGYQFYLAQSGSQAGRDMSSERVNATVLAVECKRYGDETELKTPELLGKLAQAVDAIPQLDVWVLVASRSVPDQLYSALRHLADRFHVDVQVVSAGDEFPSSLEVLCAHSPDIVLSDLRAAKVPGIRSIQKELNRIAADEDFPRKRDRIKALFTESAGYDAARQRLQDWLLGRFSSETNSRVALGQAVDVDAKRTEGRLVPRSTTVAEFDRWLGAWPTRRDGLAVLGEEGDGKTWAVASWLSARFYADAPIPPLLWLPSREATTQDFDVLIGGALKRRLGGTSDAWIERVRRWSQPATTSGGPSLILVLDGINERHDATWWRPIIESLGAEPWRNAIAPIVTVRSGFWSGLARLPHVRWSSWTVPPFDDRELNLALGQIGISRGDLPEEILKLVRKPRYFDLAVRHRSAMAESGDVTVARLIYEDWRDRDSRRAGLPGEADFQQVIMDLAMKHRQGLQNLEKRDVLDTIATLDNREALLSELETGGILVRDGRHWRVEPSRLALGFGLLLAERLLAEPSDRDPAEALASLMEPEPDIDLKADILENATLHSMQTPGFPTQIRALLLAAWLTHRNTARPSQHSVAAYFPLDPIAYLRTAEMLWADDTNDGWAEELLKAAYSRWSGTEAFVAHFAAAFERWLGFVHVDGSPVAIRPEDRTSRKSELAAILGKEVTPGPFEYAGTNLIAIEDDGLLRLGRVALAIISEGDRRPYVRALIAAHVADALMQFPDKLDLSRWIIRTSPHDLWPHIEPEATRLLNVGSRTALQAVYRLLGTVGTKNALDIRARLPDDLFPDRAWLRDYEADPCSAGFSWRMEHCARCASRDDIPARFMAQQLAKCVKNPAFEVPGSTCLRMLPLLSAIDISKIWSGPYTTEQEHGFDTFEPVISRCNPAAFGDLIRAIARDMPNRHGLALRQVAHQLVDYRLALSSDEATAVRTTWERLRGLDRSEDRENERAEWAIFELLLQALSGEDQLDSLLLRHANALVLTRFRPHFRAIPWAAVSRRLRSTSKSDEVSRVLFFASAHPQTVDQSAVDDLTQCADSPDPNVRFIALKLIYLGDLEAAATAVVAGGWHFSGQDDGPSVHEDYWGSLVIAKWGQQLTYDELRTRIEPTLLGRAVVSRGCPPGEVTRYAEDLDGVWTQLDMHGIDPVGLPTIEVRARSVKTTDGLDLPSVDRSAFSRSVTFVARHSSWGGAPSDTSPADFMKAPSDADIQLLHEKLGETLSEQRKARNLWFARRFSSACLAEVVTREPDLVRKWIGNPIGSIGVVQRMWLARSFYETLCQVLLSEQPALGVELFRCLQVHEGAVRFVEQGTDIPLLDHALFDAKESDDVRTLWDARLNEATSDRDLLVVAMLAQSGSAKDWLLRRLSKDIDSDVPLHKTRAVLMQGFLDTSAPPPDPITATTDVVEWQAEQHQRALKNWRADHWAQTWFRRFATEDSDAVALSAFRSFLSCADSRFSRWRDAAVTDIREVRRRFVMTSLREIEQSIRKNEERLRKHFLGMDVAERQVWPWC